MGLKNHSSEIVKELRSEMLSLRPLKSEIRFHIWWQIFNHNLYLSQCGLFQIYRVNWLQYSFCLVNTRSFTWTDLVPSAFPQFIIIYYIINCQINSNLTIELFKLLWQLTGPALLIPNTLFNPFTLFSIQVMYIYKIVNNIKILILFMQLF